MFYVEFAVKEQRAVAFTSWNGHAFFYKSARTVARCEPIGANTGPRGSQAKRRSSRTGGSGSLAAVGSIKSGCSSCCADAAERGVLGSRWGVSLFCARFALSKLRLPLFEARLSGYCVREGEVKGINQAVSLRDSGFSSKRVRRPASPCLQNVSCSETRLFL